MKKRRLEQNAEPLVILCHLLKIKAGRRFRNDYSDNEREGQPRPALLKSDEERSEEPSPERAESEDA